MATQIVQDAAHDEKLRARFQRLAAQWRDETELLSSTTAKAMHPAYQQIIGLGPEALPLIFKELSAGPGHWFWALRSIAGEDPVAPADAGNVRRMAEAWLVWDARTGIFDGMDLRRALPKLTPQNHTIASPRTDEYNCIAFAAGDMRLWWWPDPAGLSYWPPSAAREDSVTAFQQAFAALGYEPCGTAELEPGFEKVAIYAVGGTPTHAARQLPDGGWASKLGELEDIEHASLDLLAGATYGNVVAIVRRRTS